MGIIGKALGKMAGGVSDSDKHVKAVWKDTVVAESDSTKLVEGNHYFPPGSIKREHFEGSEQTSNCPWKGTASYYDVVVDGERNDGAAWFYPEPKDAAEGIKDHVAFWNGVEVVEA